MQRAFKIAFACLGRYLKHLNFYLAAQAINLISVREVFACQAV